ncbi:MAG: hypothetical protein KC646_15125 [Candidatus Cloacimonetes bacterium]|nr:hypothetical protein [Candidatus Cloacimonadota bacterium]
MNLNMSKIIIYTLLSTLLITQSECKKHSYNTYETMKKASFQRSSSFKNNQGKLLFFGMKEWFTNGQDQIFLYIKDDNNWTKIKTFDRFDLIKNGERLPEGPEDGGGTTIRKRPAILSTYFELFDYPAGTYTFGLTYRDKGVVNEKFLSDFYVVFEDFEVKSGKINLISKMWNEAHTIKNWLPNSNDYLKVFHTYFHKLLPHIANPLPVESPEHSIKISFDMDYKEKSILAVPRVYLTSVQLIEDGNKEINGQVVYSRISTHGSNNPFIGRFVKKFTHIYYDTYFNKSSLLSNKCYDLKIKGYMMWDKDGRRDEEKEKTYFDNDGEFTYKKAYCTNATKTNDITLKINRTKHQTWELTGSKKSKKKRVIKKKKVSKPITKKKSTYDPNWWRKLKKDK